MKRGGGARLDGIALEDCARVTRVQMAPALTGRQDGDCSMKHPRATAIGPLATTDSIVTPPTNFPVAAIATFTRTQFARPDSAGWLGGSQR